MANTVTHGLMGATVYSGLVKVASPITISDEGIFALAVTGFVVGTFPDSLDWLFHVFLGTKRWKVYLWWHNTEMWNQRPFLALLFLGAWLHAETDIPFHPRPGYNWWAELGWFDITLLVMALFTLGIIFMSGSSSPG